jgi:hypothetical protein
MGTIADTGQKDRTSCGYYAGYVVYLVNTFGYSPGLSISHAEVAAKREGFRRGNMETLSEHDAPGYLAYLGVATGYKMNNPLLISNVKQKVVKALWSGKAMMWGDHSHWYALVAISLSKDTIVIYDPAGQQGFLNTVALRFVDSAPYLVHPAWMT